MLICYMLFVCYYVVVVSFVLFFFFFKQKTAYEIVSRDWSSDVCSSDLICFFPGSRGSQGSIADAVTELTVRALQEVSLHIQNYQVPTITYMYQLTNPCPLSVHRDWLREPSLHHLFVLNLTYMQILCICLVFCGLSQQPP